MKKIMILLIGKSGSGKSAIAHKLSTMYNLKEVQSYTTRPKRYYNEKGHIFIDDKAFDTIKDDLCAYTEFNGYKYGVTNELIDKNDVYVIDLSGLEYLTKQYKGDVKFIPVCIDCSLAQRIKRMRLRGDSWKNVISRVYNDSKMFRGLYNKTQFVVKNEKDILSAVFAVHDIYLKERLAIGNEGTNK